MNENQKFELAAIILLLTTLYAPFAFGMLWLTGNPIYQIIAPLWILQKPPNGIGVMSISIIGYLYPIIQLPFLFLTLLAFRGRCSMKPPLIIGAMTQILYCIQFFFVSPVQLIITFPITLTLLTGLVLKEYLSR